MSDPIDCISPGFSRILQARILHGILQARILEWVAISFSRASSWPRDWNCVSYISCTGRRVLYHRQQLGHQVGLYETFWGAAMLFYTMAAPSYVLAGARQGFQLLHILINSVVSWGLDSSHPDGYEVISHCCFHLHFDKPLGLPWWLRR